MVQIKISGNVNQRCGSPTAREGVTRQLCPLSRSGYRLLSILLFLSSILYAQSATATLHGLIIDEQGAVISGVEITLLNKSKALARQITTGDDGGFTFALLPPDIYLIRARRDGFTPVEIDYVKINLNDQRLIRIQLKVEGVGETVNIEDSIALQESAAVGLAIDREIVENVPLNGRNFQSLITLAPGVVLTKATSAEQGQFSVNGQRANANYFTIDGVSANTGINPNFNLGQLGAGSLPALGATGGTGNLVSLDALQEFRIQTADYAPEFGRMPGGQIAVVTRSGAGEYHGALFDYLRNDVLDANDWFANRDGLEKPALRHNNFGGTLGGPLLPAHRDLRSRAGVSWRQRTFFFLSYEGLRLRQPSVGTAIVPSIGARRMASAPIRPILDSYPLPNQGELGDGLARFSDSYSDPTNQDNLSLRIDHTSNEGGNWFARYSFAPSNLRQRTASLSQLTHLEIQHRSFTVGLTHALSPRINHDFRANYTEYAGKSFYRLDDFGGAVPPAQAAIFPSFASPRDSLVVFHVNNAESLAIGNLVNNIQRQINVVDHLAVTHGAHQFKAGFDYRHLSPINRPRTYQQVVGFTGVSGPPGFTPPPGTLLSGKAFSLEITSREPVTLHFTNFSAYGQDTWRITPRLTFTYGLRWEFDPPPRAANAKDLLTVTGLDTAAPLELAERGRPLWRTSYDNFAPRFGIVYRLSQKQGWETNLRGGFGIFYDLGLGVIADNAATYPYSRSRLNYSLLGIPYPFNPNLIRPQPFSLSPPYGAFHVFDPDLDLPRTYEHSLTLEQSFGSTQTLMISYVGARGRRLLRQENLQGSTNSNFPFGLFVTRNAAASDYHAMQLQFQRHLSRNLSILASYTWSHSLDTASNDSSLNPPAKRFDPRKDRGPSDFDIRHAWSGAVTYRIPALPLDSFPDQILRNWVVDAIIRARTSTPVDVTFMGYSDDGAYRLRPDLVPGVPVFLNDPAAPGGKRINTTLLSVPNNPAPQIGPFLMTDGTRQGTLGRNALRGFPFWQTDFALHRQFDLIENIRLQFKAEFFNLFNHPNFADPLASLTDPSFGTSASMLNKGLGTAGINGGLNPVYQIGGPRSIQMVLKLSF